MNPEAAFDVYVENGALRATDESAPFERIGGHFLYEVIKLIDGVPLFFEDHIARLRNSAQRSGITVQKPEAEMLDEIALLVEKNERSHVNVKLVCGREGDAELFLTYLLNTEYPGPDAYRNGVHTILFEGERKNPNVKTVKGSFRQQVKAEQERTGAYEALLVNEEGYITEGSRSNVFFVKSGDLYTPPSGAVLMGVTRKHVLEICRRDGVPVKEALLHRDDVPEIEGTFITGTTVDVLPVRSIGDVSIASTASALIAGIIDAYNAEVDAYIRAFPKRR